METLRQLLAQPYIQALVIVLGSIVAAFLTEVVIARSIAALASRTKTDLDDKIVEITRRPVFISVLIYGLSWAARSIALPEQFAVTVTAILQTIVIITWTIAGMRVGTTMLHNLSAKGRGSSMFQARTVPVLDIVFRIVAIGGGTYFVFLAWHIDLTAWLASAGIIGIAVGFAAKDSLANLFSGLFILADAPYRVKDWVVLDKELRGEVTQIGIRSTRILTPDDVEITVPNNVIGNVQVLNETGGPHLRQRLRIKFSVAYGAEITRVKEVVEAAVRDVSGLLPEPTPCAMFRALGDSGLEFEIWVWIEVPKIRERVIDEVTTRVYDSLNAAKIEIPYPKRDIYIREMPKNAPSLR